MNIALKEWASAVRAISTGRQILLLRKGGIVEADRGGFQLRHREFLLFPTFEHQHTALLKPEHATLIDASNEREIDLSLLCQATDIMPAPPIEQIRELHPEFVWNDRFLEMRYGYKPHLPLSIVFVRAYQLRNPLRIPNRPSYAGCKSWVHLTEEIETAASDPVLTNNEYEERCQSIAARLGANLPTMG